MLTQVDADMEISAIDATTSAKLEVDRALDTANKTLHCSQEETQKKTNQLSPKQSPKLQSIKDKRVYTEVYESDTKAKVINGKWLLKSRKARYVLSAFEEDVKDEDVVASTTMVFQARDLRSEGYTVFHWRRENRLPQRTHQGRRRGVVSKATTRVATGGTGSQQGYCDLETTEESAWSGKLTERQDHLGDIWRTFSESASLSQTCLTLGCGLTPTTRVSLVSHVDDLLLSETRQTVPEILSELKRDSDLKSSEVTTKPTRHLGRTLVRTKEGHNFRADAAYVEDMLVEFNMSALKQHTNTALGTPSDR